MTVKSKKYVDTIKSYLHMFLNSKKWQTFAWIFLLVGYQHLLLTTKNRKIQCISKVCFCSLVILHQDLNIHENNREKENIILSYAKENGIWDQQSFASDVSNMKRKCNIFIKMKFGFEVLFLFVKTSQRSILFL